MLKNCLKTAFRYLFKHKLFSIIYILCLSLGITFTLIIGIYAFDQYSINHSLNQIENQYILKSKWNSTEIGGLELTTLAPLAKTMYEEYPDLVANYYGYNSVTNVVSAGDKHFMENIAIGDTTFVQMYGFPVLFGDKKRPFINNHSAVITEAMAIKLFGKANVINETISIHTTVDEVKQDYTISAVIGEIPFNSVTELIGENHTIYVPTEGNLYYPTGDPSTNWSNIYQLGMIQLQKGRKPEDLATAFKTVLKKYTTEDIQEALTVQLAPLKTYYLDDNNGAIRKMVQMLGLAALFILLMAIVNFINISVGTAVYRLKEIAVRKISGGNRSQLIVQFLGEALLLTFLSALLSLPLYEFLKPWFSEMLHTSLISVLDFQWETFVMLFGLSVLTGLLAGLYPAFVLSSANIVMAAKGRQQNNHSHNSLRKTILVVQFTLAIVAFIGAVTISRQLSFMFTKDIGYNKDQVMVVSAVPKKWDEAGVQKMITVQQNLRGLHDVQQASLSFEIPNRLPPNTTILQDASGEGAKLAIPSVIADEHYTRTFGIKLLAGNCFAAGDAYTPNVVVLNVAAVKALGLDIATALNRKLRNLSSGEEVTIGGVLNDFNYSSLQDKIEPLVLVHVKDEPRYRFLSLKLRTDDMTKTVLQIEHKWKEILPDSPFEYTFMDEQFASLYKSELQLRRAADVATILNFLIVLMGVFGMMTFTLSKRTKEVAIRKVLGANIGDILFLFMREYAAIIIVANLIAWPTTYFLTNSWLQNYAYKINQNMWLYLLVGVVVFASACTVIMMLCIKTVRTNSVKSLRSE